jgi:hypothetical protein
MSNLSQERCFNHPDREAAARCPECRRFFCRECVTEHEERVICAACLARIGLPAGRAGATREKLRLALRCAAAFLFLWLLFYAMGRGLLRVPSAFHEGVLWKPATQEAP